jgi:hypothetical protein
MESKTVIVSSAASASAIYDYAVDPTHLPRWAGGLCKSVAQFDDRWIVDSPMGPIDFAFAERNPFGVLDHDVVLEDGRRFHNPMRVIPNGEGSEIHFTVFRVVGTPDADFERDAGLVRADLKRLAQIVEGRLV